MIVVNVNEPSTQSVFPRDSPTQLFNGNGLL